MKLTHDQVAQYERDGHLVVENVTIACASQIEIAVIGKIDNCRFVCSGFIAYFQLIAVRQRIGNNALKVTGKSLVTVGAEICKSHTSLSAAE